MILIRGDAEDQQRVAAMLHYRIGEFPCKYLELQLAIKLLTKAEWQLMIDQAKQFVSPWQQGLIQCPGQLVLVKFVIAATSIHHLMVSDAHVWFFRS